jgi:hypothetical protein
LRRRGFLSVARQGRNFRKEDVSGAHRRKETARREVDEIWLEDGGLSAGKHGASFGSDAERKLVFVAG